MEATQRWEKIFGFADQSYQSDPALHERYDGYDLHLLFIEIWHSINKKDIAKLDNLISLYNKIALKSLQSSNFLIDLTLDLFSILPLHLKTRLNDLPDLIFNTLTTNLEENEIRLCRLIENIEPNQRMKFFDLIINIENVGKTCSRRLAGLLLDYFKSKKIKNSKTTFLYENIKSRFMECENISHLLLELHYLKPDQYLLTEDDFHKIEDKGQKDAETKRLLGLVKIQAGHVKEAKSLLIHSLYYSKPDAKKIHSLFKAFLMIGEIGFARKCVAQISEFPHCSLSIIRDLVKNSDKVPMGPYLEIILEKVSKKTNLSTDTKLEVFTMLLKEMLRQNKGEDAISFFTSLEEPFKFNPGVIMRIIEKMIDLDRIKEAENHFHLLKDKNIALSIHYNVLRARAFSMKGEYLEARTLLEKKLDLCGEDEHFLIELGSCYIREKSWRKLRGLLISGQYLEPSLKAMQIIAHEKGRDFGYVIRQFNISLLEYLNNENKHWFPVVLDEFIFSAFYCFAIEGLWSRIRETAEQFPYPIQSNATLIYFTHLARIYMIINESEWQDMKKWEVLSIFEILLVSPRRPKELELMIRLFEDVILNTYPELRRVEEFSDNGTYLLFLVIQKLEEASGFFKNGAPEKAQGIRDSLANIRLSNAIGFMRQAEII